jgi:hypothetical protein
VGRAGHRFTDQGEDLDNLRPNLLVGGVDQGDVVFGFGSIAE